MMKKALNIIVCSVIATVFLSFNTEKVWADSFTMADIAMSEYLAGEREDPMGSDRIKYNEWYYGYPVGNTDLQNDLLGGTVFLHQTAQMRSSSGSVLEDTSSTVRKA